jgi:hypothetical protein
MPNLKLSKHNEKQEIEFEPWKGRVGNTHVFTLLQYVAQLQNVMVRSTRWNRPWVATVMFGLCKILFEGAGL